MTGTHPQFQFNLKAESYTFCAAIVGKVHVTCWPEPEDSHGSSSRRNKAQTRKSGERKGTVQQSTDILGDGLIKIKVIRQG